MEATSWKFASLLINRSAHVLRGLRFLSPLLANIALSVARAVREVVDPKCRCESLPPKHRDGAIDDGRVQDVGPDRG